jgi:hypothetical protein
MFGIDEEMLSDSFDISNGVLGILRDTFLSLMEHMRYREKTMLKNVKSLFYCSN